MNFGEKPVYIVVLLPNQFLLSSHPQLRNQINKVFKFAFEKNNLAFEEINRQEKYIFVLERRQGGKRKMDPPGLSPPLCPAGS